MNNLFENFLKDRDIYNDCISFWNELFNDLLSNIEYSKYFNTQFNNEEDFFDGNPIFNFKIINSERAVFIVQEEHESENVSFNSWIDKFESDKETIERLVILLELNEKTKNLTIDLVKEWIVKQKSIEEIEEDINLLTSNIPKKIRGAIFSEIFNMGIRESMTEKDFSGNKFSLIEKSSLHELLEI